MTDATGPLAGYRATEIAGGVGGAWTGRLLAALGADVARLEPEGGDPLRRRREDPDAPETEGLLHAWLSQGKRSLDAAGLDEAVAASDLLILGEDAPRAPINGRPRHATLDLSWFGPRGPRGAWRGADLAVQALTGMIHPCGPEDGPPLPLGDLQAAMIGGVAAATAGLAALYAGRTHRLCEVSILESCLVLSDLQINDAQSLDRPCPRNGVNRFHPTCPVSIHRCKTGWLGVTCITAAQWAGLCEMLERPDLAADPRMATIHTRSEHADEIEAAINAVLPGRSAEDWAALGRELKVPCVVVPDAGGLLSHPVFTTRGTFAKIDGRGDATGPASPLRVEAPGGPGTGTPPQGAADPLAPLSGLRIADFSMGWAGPLATRILADLGAEVIKIEAGRYPDWWRGTLWDADSIAAAQYETSRRFSAVNRNKASVSFDLTTEEGKALARALVAASDAVVENHAAGVMPRLGMGWEQLSAGREDLVMLSMSAFGSGNVWSDTRAYGSTLEQGSGLPSFRGAPGGPPTMGHIAYGDPVGGIHGAACLLAALIHRKRTGLGQWMNVSQCECLLPFTAPAVLSRSVTGREPPRPGMRHAAMAPHGIYPAAGEDAWIAIAAPDDAAWRALATAIGRPDLAEAHPDFDSRRRAAAEIDAAISAASAGREAEAMAAALQAAGVVAAPVLKPEQVIEDPHLDACGTYVDVLRAHIAPQRQFALSWTVDGARTRLRGPAPLLGADTQDVLTRVLGRDPGDYAALTASGVISLRPTALRGAAPARAPEPAAGG
ncbi:MAG: CoA transferase [Rhodobacteraceae bacterium]|nr:CoA transferase [Paracoccaceae bacterium]